jgi:hypothetical protein
VFEFLRRRNQKVEDRGVVQLGALRSPQGGSKPPHSKAPSAQGFSEQ